MPIEYQADTEMLEFYCDNNQSRERISKTSAGRAVQVPVTTLSRYVGTYDVVDHNNRTTVVSVTLAAGTLHVDYGGKGTEELVPLSATKFSWSGTSVDFSTGANGVVTLEIHYAEGSETGPRRR
jgi:hypothetical protein